MQDASRGLDNLRRQYSKPLYFLMTLVGLILAIACANLANLLLARAAGRRREMAVRLSLGAGRGRDRPPTADESVLLATLGGALGLVFAQWGVRGLSLLMANGRDTFLLNVGPELAGAGGDDGACAADRAAVRARAGGAIDEGGPGRPRSSRRAPAKRSGGSARGCGSA